MRRGSGVTAHHAKRFTGALIAMTLTANAGVSTSWADSIYQTGPFRSLCSSVEISAEPEIFRRFERAPINENVARVIEARLRKLDLNYPILAGPECLRERASAPRQLSLQFYARAVSDPEYPRRLVISLIMHSYYKDTTAEGSYHRDIQRAHHEFPTDITFCSAESDSSRCLTDHVVGYFDATMLKIIERSQELLKGGRR